MRRLQYDAPSQGLRNLVTNPELVAATSDKVLFKNVLTNPSFEATSGTALVRTNLATNPAFESSSGTVTVRQNLAPNPSFEATSGTTTVRTNLITHPSFELGTGTVVTRTNYATNPSMETSSSTVAVRTNLAMNPSAVGTSHWTQIGVSTYSRTSDTSIFRSGDSAVRYTLTGNGSIGAKCQLSGGVTSGETLSWSIWVYPSVACSFQPYWERNAPTYSGGSSGSVVACPANTWTKIQGSQTFSAAQADPSGVFGFGFYYSLNSFVTGDWFTVDELIIERVASTSALSQTFFDGATSASGDFTYAWTGTANASASEQRGVNVAGRTGLPPGGTSWQSSSYARSGTKSAAVLVKANMVNNASLWYPGPDLTVGTEDGQLPANTQVTWSVYVYIPSGSTAKVMLCDVTGGGGTYGAPSADLYNQWQRISHTFTTPASGTINLRLRTSGAGNVAGTTFWIDDEMLEVASSPSRYFDAANPIQNLCVNPSFATGITNYTSISASLSRITTMGDGHVGELTQTIANAARQGAIYLSPTILKQDTYTVSFNVSGTAPEFTSVRCFLYDNASATIVSQTPTPTITMIKDGTFNRYTFNLVAASSFDRIYLEVLGTNIPIGAKAWIDRVLIEKGTTAPNPYYEGTGDFTYAWTGTANASMSTQTATNISGWGSLGQKYQSTLDPKVGTYCGAVATRGVNGDGMWPGTNLDVTAGRSYTYSAWVKVTTPHSLTAGFRWYDAGMAQIGLDTNVLVTSQLIVGSWALVTATAVAPATATKLQMMLRIYETHAPTTFYMDGVICAESMTPIAYFDGATPASGDFTYAWSGAANASTSWMRATGVVDNPVLNAVPVSSTEWKGLGTKSIRIIPTLTHTNDSFTAVAGDTGALRLGLQAGKTYTISATIRLTAPQTGTISSRARKIVVFHKSPADQFHAEAPSNQAPNAAGETRVSVTVTLPATTNEAFVRLYNGAYGGHGDVWWDNLLVEEVNSLRPYFDGTTPARENLAKTPASANAAATTHTTGVSYAGSTWTRSTTAANGTPLTRQYVDAASLRAGETYTASVTLANDQAFSQSVSFDWCDVGSVSHTLAPGEIKRITTSGFRPATGAFVYGSVYRFSDLHVQMSTTEDRSILFKDWLIELGATSGEYYAGTGDFTYSWAGTENASVSREMATGLGAYLGANNAVFYRSGTAGSYKGRVSFTNGLVADSGVSFSGVTSFNPSKYYTIAVDMTSDTTRTVKFSAQGTGANALNSANITLTAGVKARHSFTFTTTATAPAGIGLYLLRTDLALGSIDFDNLIVEEGTSAGPYFDGANPVKNLADNPNVDVTSTGWATNDATMYPAVRSTVSPIRGTASYLSTRSSATPSTTVASIYANGKNPFTLTALKVTPGDVLSFSLDIKVSQPNRRVNTYFVFRTASSVSLGILGSVYTNLTNGVATRAGSTNVTVPANADSVIVVATVSTTDGSNALTDEQVWFDGLLIEKSATMNDYYEGTGDFTYAWSGTANSSTSTVTAPKPATMSTNPGGRVSWQSSTGPVEGKKSIAVLGGVPNVDTFAELATIPFAGETLGGRTFTILATRKTTEALPASGNDSRAWRPLWQVSRSGGAPTQAIMPPIGPTTAGVYKFKYTFTFDADVTTSYFFRLYNGSATGGSTVWWDDVSIIEGAYPGEYFDGDTVDTADTNYVWDGTANASASSARVMNVRGTWFGQRAAIYSSNVLPFSGSHKVKAVVSQLGYFPRLVSNTMPVTGGRRYTVAAKMKCSTQPVQVAIAWVLSNGNVTSPVSQSASNGVWTKVSLSTIAPSDAVSAQLYLGVPDNAPLNTEFEIDNLMFVGREYDGPFGSGDTYGWQWEGTPHESTSKGYPVGLTQLAGKPLSVVSLPGQYVLTDIDPTKNPVIPDNAPRTIYTIVENLKDNDGPVDAIWTYGVDDLSDATHPNQTITLRLQAHTGADVNALNSRRTGGGGPIALNVPSSGRQILISGLNENGYLFSGYNKSALTIDNVVVSIPHERIVIATDNTYHRHVITYIYRGVHSSALRAEMVRLLADAYSIPGLG